MPDLISHAADNPEFARVIELARLRDLPAFAFDIAPDATEAAALARLLDARSVRKMRFRGRLAPLPGGGWRLEGRLGATVVQTCVVTLDPVTTRIDHAVGRTFLPGTPTPGPEVVVGPDEEDEVEPLGERIDLGLIALETLALALPAYPRKPGATLAQVPRQGQDGLEDGSIKPFAALAVLRDKLGEGS